MSASKLSKDVTGTKKFRRTYPTLTPVGAQYLSHGQLGIVVEDALGHSAQKGEGLGGLGRIGLHEATVAVGQIQDESVGFPLHAADDHQRLAKVALGMARRMGQRDEHLPSITTTLPQFGRFLARNCFAEGKATKLSSV